MSKLKDRQNAEKMLTPETIYRDIRRYIPDLPRRFSDFQSKNPQFDDFAFDLKSKTNSAVAILRTIGSSISGYIGEDLHPLYCPEQHNCDINAMKVSILSRRPELHRTMYGLYLKSLSIMNEMESILNNLPNIPSARRLKTVARVAKRAYRFRENELKPVMAEYNGFIAHEIKNFRHSDSRIELYM